MLSPVLQSTLDIVVPSSDKAHENEGEDGNAQTSSSQTTELGCRLWTAAVLLCAILEKELQQPEQQQQQPPPQQCRILEIGAGVGACGFFAAAAAVSKDESPSSLSTTVTITDCGPQTLHNLAQTLARYAVVVKSRSEDIPSTSSFNSSASSAMDDDDPSSKWSASNVCIRRLLWEEDLEIIQAQEEERLVTPIYHWSKTRESQSIPTLEKDTVFDLILGSDLLYFSCQEASLLATLQRRLASTSNTRGRGGGRALILQTMRTNNVLVFARFVEACRATVDFDVTVQDVDPADWCTAQELREHRVNETPHTTGYKLVTIKKTKEKEATTEASCPETIQ